MPTRPKGTRQSREPSRAATCLEPDFCVALDLALPYCNKAIALDPNPRYYDSRGVTFALLNDFDAAIADFQLYVAYLEEQDTPTAMEELAQRTEWVEALSSGLNPLTPHVLAVLRTP